MPSDENSAEKKQELGKTEAAQPVEPDKPPDADSIDPELTQILIKHYSDQFWSGLTKTNVALLAWIGALVLIFIDPILFLSHDVKKQSNLLNHYQRQQVDAARKTAKEIQAQQASVLTSPSPSSVSARTTGASSAPLVSSPAPEAAPSRESAKVAKAVKAPDAKQPSETSANPPTESIEDKKQEAMEGLSKLRTPIGELSIKAVYAPLIWSVFFLGLLLFFLHKRVVLIATLSKAIDLHMKYRPGKISTVSGLGSWSPFWLAPLPRASKESPFSEDVLKQYLGWTSGGQWRVRVTFACLGAALILSGVVVWTSIELVRFSSNPKLAFALSLMVIGTLIASVMITFTWLLPEVRFGAFPEKLVEPSKGRRRFLQTSIGVVGLGFVSGLVALAMPRKPLMMLRVISRFPRWRRAPNLYPRWNFVNRFVLNGRSGVVHYIGANGLTSSRIYLNIFRSNKKIEALEDKDIPGILNLQSIAPPPLARRVDWRQAGALSECLALAQIAELSRHPEGWNDNQRYNILHILLDGILLDTKIKKRSGGKPSYRLYDLFAGLAYRFRIPWEPAALIQQAKTNWPEDRMMLERISKWSSPSERWKKKWDSDQFYWKAAKGNPRKDEGPKGGYSGYCK